MSFDYYLADIVDRDVIRNANNNLIALANELWVFGTISDGVLAEIKQALGQKKRIRYSSIKSDKDIKETSVDNLACEDGLENFKNQLTNNSMIL